MQRQYSMWVQVETVLCLTDTVFIQQVCILLIYFDRCLSFPSYMPWIALQIILLFSIYC